MTSRALCFDATGTLIETTEPVGEIYRRVALDFGVDLPAWRLDDAFRRVLRRAAPRGVEGATREARRDREVEWWSDLIRQTFQATDSTVAFEDFPGFAQTLFELYCGGSLWRARPGILDALRVLRDQGFAMAIASNFDHRLPNILQALDLKYFFDPIEIPIEHGFRKPERPLFEFLAKSFDRPLAGLTYIGDDDAETLAAIRSHGLRVLDIREVDDLERLPALLAADAIVGPPESGSTPV